MLSKIILLRILESLCSGRKGIFTIKCSSNDTEYCFVLDKEFLVTQSNNQGINITSVFSCVEEMVIPNTDYKIISIEEAIYTSYNTLYTRNFYNCIDNTQIYLPVFRVLGEQVVFLLKFKDTLKRMFFINGRVFYTDVDDNNINLYQSSLRQIFSLFPNSSIEMFEKLPRRYSYSTVFQDCVNAAKQQNKKFISNKNGVRVEGEIRC